MSEHEIKTGDRIRVIQEIERREGNWLPETVGTVIAIDAEQTGSWHVVGKDQKLWLTRIRLKKDNGEITTLVSDRHTRIEILEAQS